MSSKKTIKEPKERLFVKARSQATNTLKEIFVARYPNGKTEIC